MKIDIWSDFVCPFCYVGKKKFEIALKEFNYSGEIEINYRSFQLEPNLKKGAKTDVVQGLANNYGIPREKAQEMVEQAVAVAKQAGLIYDYKNMIPANTFDAHRVAYYAKENNKDGEIVGRILKAHFADGLNIEDQDILSNLAEEVGLNKEEIIAMLNSDKYINEVNDDMKEAMKLGIDTIPTFVFNDKYSISGAQSPDAFLEMLEKTKE